MQPARIAELLAPFLGEGDDQRLTAADLERISTYIDILLRWNARVNMTAIRDPEQIVTRHFGESLLAARILFPSRDLVRSEEVSIADLGSGAGFPGIPIKLWNPQAALTLIESNHKKATFLREVARVLTLTNIDIRTARAESLANATFGVVTLRAVERFEAILSVAARLVAPGGQLTLLIGSAQLPLAKAILCRIAGFHASQPASESIPFSRTRVVVVAKGSS